MGGRKSRRNWIALPQKGSIHWAEGSRRKGHHAHPWVITRETSISETCRCSDSVGRRTSNSSLWEWSQGHLKDRCAQWFEYVGVTASKNPAELKTINLAVLRLKDSFIYFCFFCLLFARYGGGVTLYIWVDNLAPKVRPEEGEAMSLPRLLQCADVLGMIALWQGT